MARRAACTRLRLTVLVFEDVEDGEDLPVVGHQRFSHQVGRHHQVLQDLQGGADHLAVSGVQGVCGGKGKERRGWSKTEAASMDAPCREKKKNSLPFQPVAAAPLHALQVSALPVCIRCTKEEIKDSYRQANKIKIHTSGFLFQMQSTFYSIQSKKKSTTKLTGLISAYFSML